MTLWSTFFAVAFTLLAWFGLPLAEAWGLLALCWRPWGGDGGAGGAAELCLAGCGRCRSGRRCLGWRNCRRFICLSTGPPGCLHPPRAGCFYTCCFVAVLTVIPPYIAEDMRAFVMGAMPLASIAVSMTLGVFLLQVMPGVRLAQLGFLACAAAALWLWAVPGAPLACIAGAWPVQMGAGAGRFLCRCAAAERQRRCAGAIHRRDGADG